MKLRALEALVRVADSGSIRAGARALNLSQPAVTAALHQLEDELGVQLLFRTKRGVQPTHYGHALIQRARSIEAEAQRARAEISQLRGDWHGTITFAVSPAVGIELMPEIVGAYSRRYPSVKLHCREGLYPEVAPALRSGLLDFAIGPGPQDPIPESLVVEPLMPVSVVIAAAGSHPLSRAKTLRELSEAGWILSGAPPGPGAMILEWFTELRLGPPRINIVCESFLVVPAIVAATGMLATMPRPILRNVATQYGLVEVRIRERFPARTISIMRRLDSPPTPAVTALLDAIRRNVKRAKLEK